MLAVNLKLYKRNHCFVTLPKSLLSREPSLTTSSEYVVCIKPVKNNSKFYVTWDGSMTNELCCELDSDFGTKNNLVDGDLVILEVTTRSKKSCIIVFITPVDESECDLLLSRTTKIESDLLSRVKLVYKGLFIPIWLSANVRIIAKVIGTSPAGEVDLTNRSKLAIIAHKKEPQTSTKYPLLSEEDAAFFNASLGIGTEKHIQHGAILVCGPKGSGKSFYIERVLNHYKGTNNKIIDCRSLKDERTQQFREKIVIEASNSAAEQPTIFCVKNIESFLKQPDSTQIGESGFELIRFKILMKTFSRMFKIFERSVLKGNVRVAIILTTSLPQSLAEDLIDPKGRKFINRIVNLKELDREERRTILVNELAELSLNKSKISDDDLESVISRTDSFYPLDIKILCQKVLIYATTERISNGTNKEIILNKEYFFKVLDSYTPINLRDVNLSKKKSISFNDIGGMHSVKESLRRIVIFPLKYPNLMKQVSIRLQTHVLLFGPPGCGKTMVGEALANEHGLNFICVKGPEIFSKYIGSSEKSVRKLFERAEKAAPALLLLDEFDSIAPKRGHDSTGVTDRVVNQLLTLMDGAQQLKSGVHIVAATSRADLIDAALLRPGRLDCHIYCGLPDAADRLEILTVLSSKFEMDQSVDLEDWASKLEYFSGADIQSFLYTAQLKALHDSIDNTQSEVSSDGFALLNTKCNENVTWVVGNVHFRSAFDSLHEGVRSRSKNYIEMNTPRLNRLNVTKTKERTTLA